MKKLFAICVMLVCATTFATAQQREFYALQTFYIATDGQELALDNYLEKAMLPALHRNGQKAIGVFKPIGNDTSTNKRVFVLMPFKKLEDFTALSEKLSKDKAYQQSGDTYINAAYNQPSFKRMETVLLRAFSGMPLSQKPALKSDVKDKVYELRSYEGATEKLYAKKVDMFNRGDEIGLFKRLGFNAVFYGEVVAGSHMPNLMYMTSFENMAERDAHWKSFGADPAWKELSGKEEYKNTVSHADIWLLRATPYSDL